MTKVGEHITLDIIGTNKEYDPSVFEKVIQDIAKAAKAKKEYRIRMAPTIIIFKDGVAEESFKAGLDLACPVDLDELQEAIEEVKLAGAF